jgi:adenylyltransferase/sulfurtransferase
LQRQIIHQTKDIGDDKVNSAKNKLTELNPEIKVTIANELIHTDNLNELIKGVDIVLDGTDNFESRFEINKVCVENRKPLISAAVVRFEGQVSVFEGHQKNLPCYQCLYSVEGEENESCIENGVLAPVAGLIGTIQALQAIKVILNLGDQLSGSLLLVDALDLSFRKVKIGKDPKCPICN